MFASPEYIPSSSDNDIPTPSLVTRPPVESSDSDSSGEYLEFKEMGFTQEGSISDGLKDLEEFLRDTTGGDGADPVVIRANKKEIDKAEAALLDADTSDEGESFKPQVIKCCSRRNR